MEKILFVTDGLCINMAALDFATYLARLTRSKLTGIFLENLVDEKRTALKKVHDYNYVGYEVDENAEAYSRKMDLIKKNIENFEQACTQREARCNIHHDRAMPVEEIINESRYADLIVMDATTSFEKHYEGAPTKFTQDILYKAECPVIIAPSTFEDIHEIVFAYDASASAVYAIKQFTYLLPQLCDKNLLVVQIKEDKSEIDADRYNFKEWLKNHYSAIGYETIDGNVTTELFSFLFKKKNTMIVMGAYGRSPLSRLFNSSKADIILKTITQPVFIAHS